MRRYLILSFACATFMSSANNGYMNYYEQENRDPLSKENPSSYKHFQEKMNNHNPDDDFCLKVDADLFSSRYLINSCIDKNIPKLNDKQSPAGEIATAVVYQCAPEIKWSLKTFYEKNKCEMSAETGQPLSYWKMPFNENEAMNLVNQSAYQSALVKVLEFRKKNK